MTIRPEDLPKDPAALAEMVLAFDGENDDLRAEIATLKNLIFGARSERSVIVCAEQLAFDLERTAAAPPPANDDEPESDAPRAKRRKPRRNIGALPAHLPRVERVIEPASTLCPCCTGRMHRIGEEMSEALDRVPAWLRVLRTIRPKYACRACEGPIVQAPAPARLVEGGMATTALIAHVAAAKYAWQSTLYRQTQILAGHGVVVDRQTLARWMGKRGLDGPGPLRSATEDHASLRAAVLRRDADAGARPGARPHEDLPVLGACDGRSGVERSGAAGGRLRVRGRPRQEGDHGAARRQVDGYAAYVSLAGDAKMSGKVRLAYCLVHARRNFVRVHKTTNSPFAREVIERIAAVYAIEERIRGLDARERCVARQAETKPLMEALKARLVAVKDGISRRSTLIKAIDYMLERWEGLTAFLDDGRLEPDTNTVERSIRPISIGKKNSLFSGDEGGGETWAILSSLLNTAKLNGVDPEAYLVDVLERMVSGRTTNDRLHELLAWNWKAAREAEKHAAA